MPVVAPWIPYPVGLSTGDVGSNPPPSRRVQLPMPRWASHGVPIPTADSKWGPWNHWSLCSKTCDTGWQRRFRMCEGTGMQGYPCEGTGEEVKTCNEKKCPGMGHPPHLLVPTTLCPGCV